MPATAPVRTSGTASSKGLTGKTPEIQKAFDKVTAASGKLIVEQEKLNALKEKGNATDAQLIAQSQRVAKAYQDEESAIRSANSALNDHQSALGQVEVSSQSATTQLATMGNTLNGLGRAAGPAVISGLVLGIEGLAAVAANASQSILLLPAALGVAATAFGTLKLATTGFSDALEAIGDPEKFATALEALSPSAQRAALSIQGLMPAFTDLKNATQDAFFASLGNQITQLSTTYLPMVQQTTTGIAGAFNSMLSGVSGQLMTPETQASIQGFATNVTNAFQALAPAAAPLTQAFSQLMEVGSGALPRIAEAATNAARSFSDFIANASRTGELQRWLDSGLNALKMLGGLAFDAGRAFMALAPAGERILPDIVNILEKTLPLLSGLIDFGSRFGPLVYTLSAVSSGFNAIQTAVSSVNGVIQNLGNIVAPVMDKVRQSIDAVLAPIRVAISAANMMPGVNIPQIPPTAGPGVSVAGGGGTVPKGTVGGPFAPGMSAADKWLQADAAATPGASGLPNGMFRRRDGSIGYAPPPSAQTGGIPTPLAGPYAPTTGGAAAPPPQFDPSQWQVNPGTPLPLRVVSVRHPLRVSVRVGSSSTRTRCCRRRSVCRRRSCGSSSWRPTRTSSSRRWWRRGTT